MTSQNLRIGFSTVTNSIVSRFVRWLTKSKCSHAFFVYYDEDFEADIVMEASDVGFRDIPLAVFAKQNTIVALITPKVNIDAGFKWVALNYLGTGFNYSGLLGNIFVLMGRWLKRKWNNPWDKPGSVFCSEVVVVAMQYKDNPTIYPGVGLLTPKNTNPADLLAFMEQP